MDVGYPDDKVAANPMPPQWRTVGNLDTCGKPALPPGAVCASDDVAVAGRRRQTLQPWEWTLTMRQWRKVFTHCAGLPEFQQRKEQQGHVTMYDINQMFIRPWVEGTECSLAILMNAGLEKPRPANLVVCGAWGDDVEECMQAMDRFIKRNGVDDDTAVWFSLFSCPENPTVQPPIDSFRSVIASPLLQQENGGHGVVALHTSKDDLYRQLSCLFEVDQALGNKVPVRCAASKAYIAQTVLKANMLIKEGFPFEYCLDRLTTVMSEDAKFSFESDEMLTCLNARGGFPRLNRDMKDFRKRTLPREVIQRLSSFCTSKHK
jgi:hypothetical protein